MALEVTLVKTPEGVSLSRTSHLFTEQGGTFGRADTNTWQLPDPDKFLSSCHCEILWISNAYYLIDRSTNGTFLNGSPEPIGRGVKSRINNGDVFEIGDYHFSVSMADLVTSASPFDDHSLFASPPARGVYEDPFDHRSMMDNEPIFAQPLDPLVIWDKVVKAPALSNSFITNPPNSSSASIDDIFGGERERVQLDFAPVDLSQSMDQAMAWPDASRENLIPEDWEDDFSSLGTDLFDKPPAVAAVPIPTPPTMPPTQVINVAVPKPRGDRQPLADRLAAIEPALAPPPSPVEITSLSPTLMNIEKVSVVASTNQPLASKADSVFIQALGLDSSRLTESEITELTTMSGQLMREIVDGMMSVLRSRTSIKNEFRMNVTTIQPVENNPLKFSVSVDDALENMFLKKSNAYKKPVDAFREGFQEIAEHQVAMIGGIRQGFERMMERFNPDNLEKNFNKQGRSGMIPGMQKAKYWNSYTEYYSGFSDNMESSFQHLFGSDFVSAYEDQLRRLAAARKKDKQ
jgi:type VI secretion system FHA domain protein